MPEIQTVHQNGEMEEEVKDRIRKLKKMHYRLECSVIEKGKANKTIVRPALSIVRKNWIQPRMPHGEKIVKW